MKRTHKGPLRDVLAKNMRRLRPRAALAKKRSLTSLESTAPTRAPLSVLSEMFLSTTWLGLPVGYRLSLGNSLKVIRCHVPRQTSRARMCPAGRTMYSLVKSSAQPERRRRDHRLCGEEPSIGTGGLLRDKRLVGSLARKQSRRRLAKGAPLLPTGLTRLASPRRGRRHPVKAASHEAGAR